MTAEGAFLAESAPQSDEDIAAMERALGSALAGFASELRLIDALDFAAFIRIGQMANLRSLVQSSAEPYFKPGTIELCELGHVRLSWIEPPEIVLPLKFRHAGVRVYFRLRLAARTASVELESIAIDDGDDADGLEEKLIMALGDASTGERQQIPGPRGSAAS